MQFKCRWNIIFKDRNMKQQKNFNNNNHRKIFEHKLKEAGVPENQAKILIETINDAAIKQDLEKLKQELKQIMERLINRIFTVEEEIKQIKERLVNHMIP